MGRGGDCLTMEQIVKNAQFETTIVISRNPIRVERVGRDY